MAVNTKITVTWYVMVCNLVERYQSFKGSTASIFSAEGFLLIVHFPLMMETVGSAKTPVPFYWTTQYSILETKLVGLEGVCSVQNLVGTLSVLNVGFRGFPQSLKAKCQSSI
jgi:hypothetical protein